MCVQGPRLQVLEPVSSSDYVFALTWRIKPETSKMLCFDLGHQGAFHGLLE